MRDYPEVELTEIVRQKDGNPIIDLSRNLSLIKEKVEKRSEEGGYIYRSRVVEVEKGSRYIQAKILIVSWINAKLCICFI
jgi:hypothetical protein